MKHGIYAPKLAAMLAENAGQKWRPSNGTEGELFYESFCAYCRRETKNGCLIQLDTILYSVEESGYPKEWQYGKDGQPVCTVFEPANEKITGSR